MFVFFLSLVVSYAGSFDANVACSPAWKMPHCLILRCPKQFMHSWRYARDLRTHPSLFCTFLKAIIWTDFGFHAIPLCMGSLEFLFQHDPGNFADVIGHHPCLGSCGRCFLETTFCLQHYDSRVYMLVERWCAWTTFISGTGNAFLCQLELRFETLIGMVSEGDEAKM